MMKNSLQKIKTHVRENRAVYITGGVCLIVGVAGGTLLRNNEVVNVRAIQILTWKSKQTLEVYIEARGHPGNVVQDMTTGIVYASQNQAADALGVNPARIGEHLAGKLPNVKGHTFAFLGKAAVPEAA